MAGGSGLRGGGEVLPAAAVVARAVRSGRGGRDGAGGEEALLQRPGRDSPSPPRAPGLSPAARRSLCLRDRVFALCTRGFSGPFPSNSPPPPPEFNALRPRVSARVEVGREVFCVCPGAFKYLGEVERGFAEALWWGRPPHQAGLLTAKLLPLPLPPARPCLASQPESAVNGEPPPTSPEESDKPLPLDRCSIRGGRHINRNL